MLYPKSLNSKNLTRFLGLYVSNTKFTLEIDPAEQFDLQDNTKIKNSINFFSNIINWKLNSKNPTESPEL